MGVRAEAGGSLDHDVGTDARAVADLHAGPDHRIGADLDVRAELGLGGDDRRRVDVACHLHVPS